jgi:hypothetical protein
MPGDVSVDMDGRILPTFTPKALISELTAMAEWIQERRLKSLTTTLVPKTRPQLI